MNDGKYIVHRHLNGKDSVLGKFEIKKGEIVFRSEVDKHNIDQFPAGPMSKHTENRIEYLMTNTDKDVYIKKA